VNGQAPNGIGTHSGADKSFNFTGGAAGKINSSTTFSGTAAGVVKPK